MPLKKIVLKPGVNRENTRYTNEGGYYVSDKIRFRQGTPETIGGWIRISANKFLGICRALFSWVALTGAKYMAVGTNLKYYIELGGNYYDITPIRSTTAAGDVTFAATNGSSTITVTDVANGCVLGDFVTFSDAVSLGGNITADVLNQEYQITSIIDDDTYTFTATATANSSDVGNGGSATIAEYQINVGPAIQVPLVGWGAGAWGVGAWGVGSSSDIELRLWTQSTFGEDLIFGPRYGGIYYWDASGSVNTRAVALSSMFGASGVPTAQSVVMVSDVSRFVLAFGANPIGSSTADPLLIRWSDQEDPFNWTPDATNQAGDLRLSHGSEIKVAIQTRQEIFILTDMSAYGLQYLGAPLVWGATLLADGISCISPNGAVVASGVVYWMGLDKFYKYDGNVVTLRCDLREFVFTDINQSQPYQVFAGSNEAFNEVWWFYCSKNSTVVDKYVVYNYLEDIWYYGTMGRTAWIDSNIDTTPLAATYENNVVAHETGTDDVTTGTPVPINAYIETSEFDVDDGDSFVFIRRVLPDITFRTSTGASPEATLTISPMKNSGSGYNNPQSLGGSSSAGVVRTATAPIEEFTGQVFVRVRGRQFVMKLESNKLGTAWQMGSMRIDMRPDGRRG